MICFGYTKLTFNISMAFIAMLVAYKYVYVQINFAYAFLCRCFDSRLSEIEDCFKAAIVTYRRRIVV